MAVSIRALINRITIVISTLATNAEEREDYRILFEALVAAQNKMQLAIEDAGKENRKLVAEFGKITMHQQELQNVLRNMIEEQCVHREILRRMVLATQPFECI